jgi:DNA-directed RNA polymerase subunit K/omega
MTNMKLTRYEKARIIGARALQLSMGAPTLLKISEDLMSPLSISIKELEAGVIPITVRRSMPQKKEIDEVK